MPSPPADLRAALAEGVSFDESSGNMGVLMERLHALRDGVMADALVAAAEPWLHMPEVAGPIYERVVHEQPRNARALVILANSYWRSGRGPEVVGELASRAIGADPDNRDAWHMWALTPRRVHLRSHAIHAPARRTHRRACRCTSPPTVAHRAARPRAAR